MSLFPTFSFYYPENSIQGQCGVFAHKLVQFPPVGDTIITKKAAVNKYGIKGKNCQIGDVVILDVGTKAGHVLIINDDKGANWQVTESNWKNDERVHHTRLLSKASPQIYGFFQGPLKVKIINPMIISKVTLYRSNITNPQIIDQGLALLNTKLPADFTLITTVLDTTNTFTAMPTGVGTQIEVNPDGIITLPTDGKVICLVHNVPTVTNPYQNPIKNSAGATCIQIPEKWYSTFPEAFAEFYLHELLHAYYYLIGHLTYTEQVAKVHDPGPDWGGYIQPIDYYISLINELRPHWPMLASAESEPMIIIHKKSDPKTKFAITSDVKNGFVDITAYNKQTAGRAVVDVAIEDAEFNKIPNGANFKS